MKKKHRIITYEDRITCDGCGYAQANVSLYGNSWRGKDGRHICDLCVDALINAFLLKPHKITLILEQCRDCDKPVDNRNENRCSKCLKIWEKSQKEPYKTEPVQGEWTRSTRTDAIGIESDFLQPIKRDGTLNPHFIEKHGTKKIEKELNLTQKQIREQMDRPSKTARELAEENHNG